MELSLEELVALCRKNIPPPENDILKYNSVVSMTAENRVLYGVVCWSPTHKKYQFELVQRMSETTSESYELTLENPRYDKLRGRIRATFGVTMTPGIHKQSKPSKIDYPSSLRFLQPTEVKMRRS